MSMHGKLEYASAFKNEEISDSRIGKSGKLRAAVKEFYGRVRDGVKDGISSISETMEGLSHASYGTLISLTASFILLMNIVVGMEGCAKPDRLPKEPEYSMQCPTGLSLSSLREQQEVTFLLRNYEHTPVYFMLTREAGVDSFGLPIQDTLIFVNGAVNDTLVTGPFNLDIPVDSTVLFIGKFKAPDFDIDNSQAIIQRWYSLQPLSAVLFDSTGDSLSLPADSLILENNVVLRRIDEGATVYLNAYQNGTLVEERNVSLVPVGQMIFTLEAESGEVYAIYVIDYSYDAVTGIQVSVSTVRASSE